MMLFYKYEVPEDNKIARLICFGFAPAIMFSVIVLMACMPVLSRSLWIDEAMLFNNYPLPNVMALFHPLPLYDQAATPIYSILMSLLSGYEQSSIRATSLFIISLASISIFLKDRAGWRSGLLVLMTMTLFMRPLIMLSELKHYGLEVVGVLIAVTWYLSKDITEDLGAKDIVILIVAALFGISTMIVSAVVLACFAMARYQLEKHFQRRDLALFGIFGITLFGYYLFVSQLTSIQINNNYNAYLNKGILRNINALREAILIAAGRSGTLVVSLSLLILIFHKQVVVVRKLLIVSFTVALAFVVIAGVGLYPASTSRHVTWAVAFFWLIILQTLFVINSAAITKPQLLFKYAFMAGCLILSINNIASIWYEPYEDTENNQAISYIRGLPASPIGLWIGGQPVVGYYSKIYPDLTKHNYFGLRNPVSAPIKLVLDAKQVNLSELENHRKEPSAWGYLVVHKMVSDYLWPARSLVSEAPKNTPFFIFATQYELHADESYKKARVYGLHLALSEAKCQYKLIKEYKKATIYDVQCPES